MSLYALQRCMFDRVVAGPGADPRPGPEGYRLDDAERCALEADDIGALFRMGVHAVLLNSYCRLIGLRRSEYRAMLPEEPAVSPEELPWLAS